MYDTIILNSPSIASSTVFLVEEFCKRYEGVDLSTGETFYSFTSCELDGSYDYRVRVRVLDYDWVKFGDSSPQKIACEPYLSVECSVHKLLLGHNVISGPTDIKSCCAFLVGFLERSFNTPLPVFDRWQLVSVDVSSVYILPDKDTSLNLIDGLKLGYYSRRKPNIYGTSVMYPGTTSTIKFYHKGTEYRKHDLKRITKFCKKQIDLVHRKSFDYLSLQASYQSVIDEYSSLADIADLIVRYECSVKSKKVKDLFGDAYVSGLDDNMLNTYAQDELKKIVGGADMHIKNNPRDVLYTLRGLYGDVRGDILFGFYNKILTFGLEFVKEDTSKPTYYRNLKLLRDAGVSWIGVTVKIDVKPVLPSDFGFFNDKYIDNSVSPIVAQKLNLMGV